MSDEIISPNTSEEAVAPTEAENTTATEASTETIEAEAAPVAEAPAAESVAEVVPTTEPEPTPEPVAKVKTKVPKAVPVVEAPSEPIVDIIDFGDKLDPVRGRRKVRVGRVVSSKMEKTVVVAVESRERHPLYGKFMKRTTKFKAHDEQNSCGDGDTVEIMETRPLSREKRWRVVRIVEKAK